MCVKRVVSDFISNNHDYYYHNITINLNSIFLTIILLLTYYNFES